MDRAISSTLICNSECDSCAVVQPIVAVCMLTTSHIIMIFCVFDFFSENNCSTLQCQEGFSCSAVGNTSLCLPVCGCWAQYPHGTVVAIDVAIVLSATVGVLASIAVLVVSCIRWEHMYVG